MRKVEGLLIEHMYAWENFNLSNTSLEVITDSQGVNQYCIVKLFGNDIAAWDGETLNITMAGWDTRTTKSRLHALLSEFTGPTGHNMAIRRIKGQDYLVDLTANIYHEMDPEDIYSIGYEIRLVPELNQF